MRNLTVDRFRSAQKQVTCSCMKCMSCVMTHGTGCMGHEQVHGICACRFEALEARVGIAESLVVSAGSLSRAWQPCRLTES